MDRERLLKIAKKVETRSSARNFGVWKDMLKDRSKPPKAKIFTKDGYGIYDVFLWREDKYLPAVHKNGKWFFWDRQKQKKMKSVNPSDIAHARWTDIVVDRN